MEIRRTFYKLDYGLWVFDKSKVGKTKEEIHIDYMLYFFDTLGHMLKYGEITTSEVSVFGFQAFQILNNEQVQAYIKWKTPHFKARGQGEPHKDAQYLRNRIA